MSPAPHVPVVILRPAMEDDWAILDRLAQLDSGTCLVGDVIVAECQGEAVAAIDVETGTVTADPFKPTAHVTAMLEMRRRHLLVAPTPRRRRFGLWGRRREAAAQRA